MSELRASHVKENHPSQPVLSPRLENDNCLCKPTEQMQIKTSKIIAKIITE